MIKLDDLFCGRGEKEEEKKEDKTKSFAFKFQHINKFDPVRFVRRVKLGEGSYGVVLQMYDKELQKEVAIKKLKNQEGFADGLPY